MDALKWREPKAYRRAQFLDRERRNPWEAARFAATSVLIVLGLRALAGLGRGNANLLGWLPTMGLALAVGLFAAYILPLLISLVSVSIVLVSEKGINNNISGHGAVLYFWPWDDVAYCSLSDDTVGGRSYRTLSLHDDQGMILATFGLPETSTADEIRDWFQRHGRRLDERDSNTDVASCPRRG